MQVFYTKIDNTFDYEGVKSWLNAIKIVEIKSVSTQKTTSPYTPERGSAERREIMDALRANVQNVRGLSGNIIFVTSKFKVLNGWAFVVASPQNSNGRPLTGFQSWCEFDQDVIGLLRKRGNAWTVVARDVCPSDVSYGDWNRRYGAPRAIFD